MLNIVLVEPQIPQNTGNISRTCAVTGAVLHLVKPYGFVIDDKHLKRAGLDYWDKLEIHEYENLDDFFEKTEGVYYYFTTKGRNVHSQIEYPEDKNVFLVFGREDKGLPEEAVDIRKQKRICKTARYYMYSKGMDEYTPVRFDVAGIIGNDITYMENAFLWAL